MFDDVITTCGCGRTVADGHETCFRCHAKGLGFTFSGGVRAGRKNWNESASDWKAEHLGEVKDNPRYQPVDNTCWT